MKLSKTISLFKIIILLILTIYTKSYWIFILSVFILTINNRKEVIIYIILIILIICSNGIKKDFIKYGIVESYRNKYYVVDKILYKVKVYNNHKINIGDIVVFNEDVSFNDDIDNLKYNYRYSYYENVDVIFNFAPRSYIYQKIDSFNNETKGYLKKILLNENNNEFDLEYIGFGFSLYYLVRLIKRKKHLAGNLVLILYVIFFKFDIKLYFLIYDNVFDLFDIEKKDKIIYEIILILLINKYLLLNYSIILTTLISLYYMTNLKKDKSYIAIIQSLFFNEINISSTIFFNYHIYIRIFLFIISLVTLFIPSFSNIYIFFISIISHFLVLTKISIRGKLNLFILFVLLLLNIKYININQYIKIGIICLILILPINNPFKHVSFIDVGQGDSILIHGALNSYNILIDTGSTYNYSKLKKELFKEGIYKIDYLIISHSDNDHSGNIDNLKNDFIIEKLVDKGEDIYLQDDYLQYLNLGFYDNDNDNSLVYLAKIDETKILFTGDISKNVENNIFEKYQINNIDFLKVSHHGSNSASSLYFIGNILPRYAIISTSGAYHHPSEEVLNNLNSYLVKTYITKDDGTITLYFFKNAILLKSSKRGCYNLLV